MTKSIIRKAAAAVVAVAILATSTVAMAQGRFRRIRRRDAHLHGVCGCGPTPEIVINGDGDTDSTSTSSTGSADWLRSTTTKRTTASSGGFRVRPARSRFAWTTSVRSTTSTSSSAGPASFGRPDRLRRGDLTRAPPLLFSLRFSHLAISAVRPALLSFPHISQVAPDADQARPSVPPTPAHRQVLPFHWKFRPMIQFPPSCASWGKEVRTMTKSIIRKAVAAVVAVAILATSTVAMARSFRRISRGQTHTYTAYVVAGQPAAVTINGDGDTDSRPQRLQPVRPAGCGRQRRHRLLRRALGPGDLGHGHDSLDNLGSVYNDYII